MKMRRPDETVARQLKGVVDKLINFPGSFYQTDAKKIWLCFLWNLAKPVLLNMLNNNKL